MNTRSYIIYVLLTSIWIYNLYCMIKTRYYTVILENSIPSHREEDDDGDYSSLSGEDRSYDIEDSVFVNGDDT